MRTPAGGTNEKNDSDRDDPVGILCARTFAVFGVPGQTTRTLNSQPFDMPAMHIYKIWGGTIHEIEAIGITIPYTSPTGRE